MFDVIEAPRGEVFIGAWPWEHGHTGLGAFSIGAEQGLAGHENPDGTFSGPAHPPSASELSDTRVWRRMSRL